MGWIQQTKQGSRKSGGPQYYLQGLAPATQTVLRTRGMCEVWLGTPYGIIESGLVAIAKDKVYQKGKLRDGKVGHDRIQRQKATASIEGEVKHWYSLPDRQIVRLDFAEVLHSHALLLLPTKVQFGRGRPKALPLTDHPLTFTSHMQSPLLVKQFDACRDKEWVVGELERVARDHEDRSGHIMETDLLRTGGALSKLGIKLGCYRGKGYDCFESKFAFGDYPTYACAVEIKKRSSGFDYQLLKRTKPERATVLCMDHDKPSIITPVVDVIELKFLSHFLRGRLAESA